jgi:hypothetical protein
MWGLGIEENETPDIHVMIQHRPFFQSKFLLPHILLYFHWKII